MSWVDVAKRKPNNNKACTSIKIEYSAHCETNDHFESKYTDGIPRHREITPDPADDFTMYNENATTWKAPDSYKGEWIDYKKDGKLMSFKRSLPLSIQRIVEFAHTLRTKQKVAKIDFDEFANDLEHQRQKYQRDKKALKKLYFGYDPPSKYDYMYDHRKSKDYEPRYTMLFGDHLTTVVHYLFRQMDSSRFCALSGHVSVSNKNEVRANLLTMLRLLIHHDIVNADDTLYAHTFGVTIYEQLKYLTFSLNDADCTEHVMDMLVNTIITCLKKKAFDDRDAVIRVFIGGGTEDTSHTSSWYDVRFYAVNLLDLDSYGPVSYHNGARWASNRKIKNQHGVIEKLLLRGLAPFQFVEGRGNYVIKHIMHDDDESMCTPAYIRNALDKHKVFEVAEAADESSNDRSSERSMSPQPVRKVKSMPIDQLSVCAPMILRPYVCRARERLNQWLSAAVVENGYIASHTLSNEIANIISIYVLLDFDYLYHQSTIEQNQNVKAMIFMNHLLHFEIDDVFIQEFKLKYSDPDFLHFVVTHYASSLSRLMAKMRHGNIDFITMLLQCYHQKYKYPLKDDGIYFMLDLMLTQHSGNFADCCQEFMQLLLLLAEQHGDEFDINFPLSVSDQSLMEYLVTGHLLRDAKSAEMMEFLLTNFKGQLSLEKTDYLYLSIKHQHLQIFKYLAPKYSLDVICATMTKMISEVMSATQRDWTHDWTSTWAKESCQEFINSVEQFCANSKCKTEDEKQKLDETVRDFVRTWRGKKDRSRGKRSRRKDV